ncbi:MAG: glycogen synthase GlgA [Candidatus Hodarchaeales archaeon]|jgi:starch synthase
MKALFITSEAIPYAKTGGLGDVSASIPASLSELGHDVKVVLPKYGSIDAQKHNIKQTSLSMEVSLGPIGTSTVKIWRSTLPETDVEIYFLENELFDREGLYQENGKDYADNDVRFILFSKGAVALCGALSWKPDIIHLNDWQSGLVPVFLQERLGRTVFQEKRPATVFTIHNIAYQGIFPQESLTIAELGMQAFTMNRLEFYGQVNFLKAGIVYSDIVSTVSPTHAEEIQGAKFGFKLEGILRERKSKLVGILHGVDTKIWNPEIDTHLVANYSDSDLSGKQECKRQLQAICGFQVQSDVPLLAMVTRLVSQKGIDLLIDALPTLITDYGVQVVILGTGQQTYHKKLLELEQQYGGSFTSFLKYDEKLAHKIQAGADIFLLPSKYEPGGLTQIISLRYGTIPVARKTGGLADTIEDYSFNLEKGNGFLFDFYSPEAFLRAIDRAVHLYRCDSDGWQRLVKRGMGMTFSWRESAERWENVYKMALATKDNPP